MKNIRYLLCCFVLLLLGSFQAQATHVSAMNLTYTCLGNNQYEITLDLYQNCSGVSTPSGMGIQIQGLGSCSTISFNTTTYLVSSIVIPSACMPAGSTDPCTSNPNTTFERSTYKTTITLPTALQSCGWRISTSLCCRNTAVTNIVNPGGQSLYTEVILVDSNSQCNNSPFIHNIPTFYVCPNNPTYISNMMTDPDGDSLVYRFADPLSAAGTAVPIASGMSTSNPFLTLNGITLDPALGTLTFQGVGGQVAQFDMIIDEYRNGVLIGINRTSFQLSILSSCSVAAPSLDSVERLVNGNWISQGQSTVFEVCPGEPLSFQMHFTDVDLGDSISIRNAANTILAAYPNALIQQSYTGSGNAQMTLRIDLPYATLDNLNIVVTDNACPFFSIQNYGISLQPRQTCGRVWGYAISDTSNNCALDPGEDSLANYIVTFTRGAFTLSISTDHQGYYNVPLDTGTYTIALSAVHPYRVLCATAQTVTSPPGATSIRHDLPIETTTLCTYMEVDIAAVSLIRCLANQYVVHYCNSGTISAPMASVEVTLDSLFVVDSTTLPIISQTGFTYTFDLGNVIPDSCGSFFIYGRLDTACTSLLGRTFCAKAYIHPDTTCGIWGGSMLEVDSRCQNDSVSFRIRNAGQLPMTVPTNYLVIEDNIIMHTGPNINLAAGASTGWIHYPATGANYRLEIEQDLSYPWGAVASATVEGCLSSTLPGNTLITGLVNTFSLDDGAPYVAIDCQPSIGSYDPNDKQAFPIGYGSVNNIEPNKDLVYRIRFQNTGTAPARDVVVLDTLSDYLDITTLQVTVASHPYTWRLKEGRILEVTFANILLPDSGSAPLASQGFFDFDIKQVANNPLGTVINNQAAIYFDRNAPIITNQVFHTIDENFIQFTDLPSIAQGDALTITAFPNPFQEFTTLRLTDGATYDILTLNVYNALGQLVARVNNQGGAQEIRLQRQNLQNGIYFYRLEGDGNFLHAGQLIAQ